MRELSEHIEWGAFTDKAERHAQLGRERAPGEYGRAHFLTMAAEHGLLRGELEHARQALEDAGPPHPGERLLDQRSIWLWLALQSADAAEVDRLLADLLADWRADLINVATCAHVGDLLESYDDLRRAHRWFTLPLRGLEPDDDEIDEICLVGRLRVRQALGLAPDRYDQAAEWVHAQARDLDV